MSQERVYGKNRTIIGEFNFNAQFSGIVLHSCPAQYPFILSEPVEDFREVTVKAEDLGYRGPSAGEEYFMTQFLDAGIKGTMQIVEFDSCPRSKEPRARWYTITSAQPGA